MSTMTATRPASETMDHRVHLHDLSWEQYEQLLEMRGEWAGVRSGHGTRGRALLRRNQRRRLLQHCLGFLGEIPFEGIETLAGVAAFCSQS